MFKIKVGKTRASGFVFSGDVPQFYVAMCMFGLVFLVGLWQPEDKAECFLIPMYTFHL